MANIDIRKIRQRLEEANAYEGEFTHRDAVEFLKHATDLLRVIDQSQDHRRYATYIRVRDYLRPVYPDIFNGREPLPLKLGIHHDLIKICEGEFSKTQIKAFLGIWCRRREYIEALRNATCRYDLNGDKHPLEAKTHEREAAE